MVYAEGAPDFTTNEELQAAAKAEAEKEEGEEKVGEWHVGRGEYDIREGEHPGIVH